MGFERDGARNGRRPSDHRAEGPDGRVHRRRCLCVRRPDVRRTDARRRVVRREIDPAEVPVRATRRAAAR